MKRTMLFGESANSSSGISRYIRALASGMQRRTVDFEYIVAARHHKRIANLDRLGVPYRTNPLKGRLQELVRKSPVGDTWLFGASSLVHEPNYQLSRVGRRTKKVLTVHDVGWRLDRTPYGLSPSFIEQAEQAIRGSDHIITPTQTVKNDVIRFFDYSPDSITVIPHGVEPSFLAQSAVPASKQSTRSIPADYWLFVGALTARKNMERAIDAIASLPVKLPLVVAGDSTVYAQHLVKKAEHAGVRMMLVSGTSDMELLELYRNSRGLLYPSLWEGFGLPIIEAASAGVPVITSSNTAMKEIADGYGFLADPMQTKEIASALQHVLELDLPSLEQLKVRGKQLAQGYCWERSVDAHLRVYRAILG